MCFFRGYDYDTFSVDTLYGYVPLEELNEIQSKRLLKKGKCNLKALWNFEITQKGKFEILREKQVQKRIKEGTFWLSAERYQQLQDPKYYDYKEDEPAKEQKSSKIKSPSGFKEWVDKTFSICTGCENDCIYCWAKKDAIRHRQVLPGKWKEMIIRQHHVDKKHPNYGRVAFPSTHDILPFNIDAYLLVLRKLLDAGNEVLIVSKPRIDCIKSICEAAKAFKEKILFRFSIGAMDDEILSFWEPNAPCFLERMDSLRYALEQGFRTSISTEPMLQSDAIEGMVHKLLPYVNDAMWIGKMNYLGGLKKKADETLMARIAEIEQGQTDERIWAIYNQFKDNPKIKWKDSIKKVVGLEAPLEPGMDV